MTTIDSHTQSLSHLQPHTYLNGLVDRHHSELVAFAERMLTDRHTAEDIVQEAFIRAWNHSEKLRGGTGSVRSWLLTVTRHLVIDRVRSSYVRHETVADEVRDVWQADHADAVMSAHQAHSLLRTLSAEHRDVLVHIYLHGYTLRETAQLLGIPTGTVKSRHHYALNALRRQVGFQPKTTA
ncbi:sigma-70 family RNA polymerase sigma factor [Streptomyces misionensis]|uniref:sigma-70 family RNA polymerase sigma factor n=1 Tax=Streptomyces misionensis TaxID=67331 RepID=UPI00368227F1